ncbi:MAG: riboflavin biosynthesis protein RibD [SAR324 cluster bacterium]|nr:riboflavin biosynthesis protein RibD [SAR324 cluster bacterium]
MKEAICQGLMAQGSTGDNPFVGCVIVRDGIIIGRGRTQPPGQAHAEVMAVRDAENHGYSLKNSTVYTTVEPCSFYGRTPPCASLLIEKQVGRVIIGIRDPHPKVNGMGVDMLHNAGIEVVEGVCHREVSEYLSDWLEGYAVVPEKS